MGVWDLEPAGKAAAAVTEPKEPQWEDKAKKMAMRVRAASSGLQHDSLLREDLSLHQSDGGQVEAEKARTAKALHDAQVEQQAAQWDMSLDATLAIAETHRKRADSLQAAMAAAKEAMAAERDAWWSEKARLEQALEVSLASLSELHTLRSPRNTPKKVGRAKPAAAADHHDGVELHDFIEEALPNPYP